MNIFIAAPISGLQDEKQYLEYRDMLLKLIEALRQKHNVYSEIEKIKGIDFYDEPKKAVEEDFRQVLKCDVFIMFHPIRTQSSTLIELGYAYAHRKEIIIVAENENLPYLMLGWTYEDDNVRFIDSSKLDSDTIESIVKFL